MYKYRLLPISLLTLVCLITPFASSKLLSATTTSVTLLPVLSPQDFITAVDSNNTQVQNGLDATLAKLLGATQQSSTNILPTNAPADTSQTSPAADTSPTTNPPTTTTTAPTTSNFNPYSN